ncbi:MAG: hypothetical protein Fur0036_18080 [Fimbriimonadaceae bacterium]
MLSPRTQFAGLIAILLLSAIGVAVFAALERALDRVKTMALAGVLGGQISPQELRPRRFALRDLSSGFARLSWVGLMLSALWLVRTETGWTWTNILTTVLGVTVAGHLIQVWVRYRAEMDPTRMLNSMRGFITLWLKSGPLIGAATAVSESLRGRNRRNAMEDAEQENAVEEEIRTLLDEAEADESWSEERTDMLESVLGFEETTAREIMTPRVDLDSVPKDASLNDVVRVVVESGHSRLPVYEESDDNILGVVHAKDVLQALMNEEMEPTLESLMRAPLFVYESNTVGEVLREMRAKKVPMAIVQDDRGATAGVVTMEDIVEELVGEIHDEYDTDEPEILLEQAANGWVVDGRYNLDDLNEEIGTAFVNEEVDTIGGYLFSLLGRPAVEGDEVEAEGYRLIVQEVDGKRIARVGVEPLTVSAMEMLVGEDQRVVD